MVEKLVVLVQGTVCAGTDVLADVVVVVGTIGAVGAVGTVVVVIAVMETLFPCPFV